MEYINVAIDGPSGAGKSTISKLIATKLKYVYIDTGAMYRAVALKMLNLNIDIKNDVQAVLQNLDNTNIDISYSEEGQLIYLDGQDVTNKIRTPEVSMGASNVAVIKEVRLKLVELQRLLAKKNNCIMDGRDIGTYVLPDANVKIFLTASAEVRAKRRYDELIEKGQSVSYEEVLEDMIKRDKNDSSRSFAPLKPAEDSIIVDTSNNTLDEAVEIMKNIILEKIGK